MAQLKIMRVIKAMKREDFPLFVQRMNQFYQLLEELLFIQRERLFAEQKIVKLLEQIKILKEIEK